MLPDLVGRHLLAQLRDIGFAADGEQAHLVCPVHRRADLDAAIRLIVHGQMTDFRAAAGILKGKAVRIDTFIVPATSEIANNLKTERLNGQTLEDVFLSAGAKIGQASCAACLGGPSDTFGRLNTPLSCISTTNRNYPGRMGHKEARVYLASPLTVAASAITGVITDPRDYIA